MPAIAITCTDNDLLTPSQDNKKTKKQKTKIDKAELFSEAFFFHAGKTCVRARVCECVCGGGRNFLAALMRDRLPIVYAESIFCDATVGNFELRSARNGDEKEFDEGEEGGA